ncbi:hypothetical protein Q8A73_006170 [Channa argus]|nr:hypothetical protein Q8A73_006170 [Channa argus]
MLANIADRCVSFLFGSQASSLQVQLLLQQLQRFQPELYSSTETHRPNFIQKSAAFQSHRPMFFHRQPVMEARRRAVRPTSKGSIFCNKRRFGALNLSRISKQTKIFERSLVECTADGQVSQQVNRPQLQPPLDQRVTSGFHLRSCSGSGGPVLPAVGLRSLGPGVSPSARRSHTDPQPPVLLQTGSSHSAGRTGFRLRRVRLFLWSNKAGSGSSGTSAARSLATVSAVCVSGSSAAAAREAGRYTQAASGDGFKTKAQFVPGVFTERLCAHTAFISWLV